MCIKSVQWQWSHNHRCNSMVSMWPLILTSTSKIKKKWTDCTYYVSNTFYIHFVSSDIFHTCSSSNIFRCHPQTIRYCIKLGQTDQYLDRYSHSKQWWGQMSWWGHWGQKRHFQRKLLSPTCYMVWSCDSFILISFLPSKKCMVVE